MFGAKPPSSPTLVAEKRAKSTLRFGVFKALNRQKYQISGNTKLQVLNTQLLGKQKGDVSEIVCFWEITVWKIWMAETSRGSINMKIRRFNESNHQKFQTPGIRNL